MVRSVSNLIENGGARLSNIAGLFFGDRLLDQDPETQRRLRATAVALALTSIVGLCFVTVWAYWGDPRASLLSIGLGVMWMALALLRQTLRLQIFASIVGFQVLVYWSLDAVLFDHLGASTYAGIYLAPVAAFLFGGLWNGRVFGGLATVSIGLLWYGGRTGMLTLQEPDFAVQALDRSGLILMMASFSIVFAYEQMFLHTMLTKADHTLNVRNHRLGLVKAQEDGVTSADLGAALASVAHDLNNPLTYALANLDYLKEEPDENSLELMQDAYDGLERMSEIVRNLGQQQGDMTEFSVEDVIDIAVRSTREEIGARATLVVDIQNPDAMILGRRSGIVQVLVNLLTNATHAVPEGQPDQQRIAIHSVTTENRVEIVVSDTGHGIPESIHNRVMEPFFTTKGIGEGTGLGLAICKRIATEHRGDLRIGTEPGETTNVTLSLPRRQRHNSRINTSTTLTVQDSELARLRVLVIDDDPGMRKLVQRALKPMKVEVLDDGRRAASLCLDHEFDVVVCDVMMPNISGEEVYRAVVAAGKEYSDRFLFMTGGVFTDGESAFLDEMEGRVLLKPMKMDALRELILERHHRGSAGPVRGST